MLVGVGGRGVVVVFIPITKRTLLIQTQLNIVFFGCGMCYLSFTPSCFATRKGRKARREGRSASRTFIELRSLKGKEGGAPLLTNEVIRFDDS